MVGTLRSFLGVPGFFGRYGFVAYLQPQSQGRSFRSLISFLLLVAFREADLACKVCEVDFCGEPILEMVGNPLQAP
jgi:hypothetical protein